MREMFTSAAVGALVIGALLLIMFLRACPNNAYF